MNVQTAIQKVLADHPQASNAQIALAIQTMIPGTQTTAASVASMKSRMKAMTMAITPLDGVQPMIGEQQFCEPAPMETYEEAAERIKDRYESLDRMTKRLVAGKVPSLIVSGPPGLGKSHTIMAHLEEAFGEDGEGHEVIRGTVSPVGLYIALWDLREGGILVLDDCDDALKDETALNLLKVVLDSSKKRRVSWKKQASWLAELGIEDSFEFTGSVVFLTNLDFEAQINKGNPLGKHLAALMDRSLYLSLTLRSARDFLIRLRQVAEGSEGMLEADLGLSMEEAHEVLSFIEENADRFYGLSLRLVRQVAQCMQADPDTWKKDVQAVKMRTL